MSQRQEDAPRRPLPTRLAKVLRERDLESVLARCMGAGSMRFPESGYEPDAVLARLRDRGVQSPEDLAWRFLSGLDLEEESRALGLTPLEVTALYAAGLESLTPEERATLEEDVARPKGEGALDPDDEDDAAALRDLGEFDLRAVELKEIERWADIGILANLLPRGPLDAVDHRPKLGEARNQGGRGTCTAFGSTVVAEAMEAFRDRRLPPRDLSEQLVFWYSKRGQIWSAGGYGCGTALRHHGEYGACEERFFPYERTGIRNNHAQVPAPDLAMDRARFYRQPDVVKLTTRDVAAAKAALRSGRCVTIATRTDNWSVSTGTVSFPDPLDKFGPGGGHCVTLIGYVDRDDLPSHHDGGYFIVRNSWGGANSSTHSMGPEYGGHLRMPYGWYSRYTSGAWTVADPGGVERPWLAEYYLGRDLAGTPRMTRIEQDLDHDWNSSTPFKITLPFIGTLNFGPSDDFSARFTQLRRMREGWYRFELSGDDGVRLWVDDRLVINRWKNQPPTDYTASHYVTGGDHVLRVEYYEAKGNAEVSLDVHPQEMTWQLFPNDDLAGPSGGSFVDTATRFEWRHASPAPTLLGNGEFSMKGTGKHLFEGGRLRFHALHSGGCRIKLDGALVLDDWDGLDGTGSEVNVDAGEHDLEVTFRNLETYPADDARTYYRAFLEFGWSNVDWLADVHKDLGRKTVFDGGWSEPDAYYRGFRTLSLTGDPLAQVPLALGSGGGYTASDMGSVRLAFGNVDALSSAAGLADNNWLSAHLRRRVFVEETGWYRVRTRTDDGVRAILDGRQLAFRERVIGADWQEADVRLEAGIHDVAIEYANTRWSNSIEFRLERAAWTVTYFDGVDLDQAAGYATVDRLDKAVGARPAIVGSSTWSMRAKRTLTLPLGRYRIHTLVDDGIRVKVDGLVRLDRWKQQSATAYDTIFEHRGGSVEIEVEYYQQYGGAVLDVELVPQGFFGEYYRGRELEKDNAAGLDRNVPIAYRWEDNVDFDFGRGARLPRIGSDEFSARWTGPVELPVGRWRLKALADDGIRVYLDGRLIIDEWQTQGATEFSRLMDLVGRSYELRVEYFEASGNSRCRVWFERAD